MTEILLWLIGAVLAGAALVAYTRYRDPVHPLIILSPMFLYVHAYVPATFFYRDKLFDFFRDRADVDISLFYTLLCVSALSLGCLSARLQAGRQVGRRVMVLPEYVRRRLTNISYLMAGFGIAVFAYKIITVGGLASAYSGPKGGGARLDTGYLSAAPLLTIPALIIYFLAKANQRMNLRTILTALVFVSPHLIQALLGGSRGVAFFAVSSLVFAWYVHAPRRPPIAALVLLLASAGVLMLFLKANRQEFYLGSDTEDQELAWSEVFIPTEESRSETSTFSMALITATREENHHFWGKRFLVQLIVRPIPKQLWPTKYHDTGMGWMVDKPGSAGMSEGAWRSAVGWFPNLGSASGLVGDSFLEFSWGGVFLCYLVGALHGFLWRKSVLSGGIWSTVFFVALVVSVYLPTQGLASAWGYRFLYLSIPSSLLWRMVTTQRSSHHDDHARRESDQFKRADTTPCPPHT